MENLVMRADFLVIGGGVIGLGIARELKRRYRDCAVALIEKESTCALHASGRNSGVLHAGFYYTANSLKARFTRDGNRELTAYCEARAIPLNRCGKLVVAQNADDLPALDELSRRARVNDVPLDSVSADEARRIEPRARTYERALYSPTTASVDPVRVVQALEQDARAEGVAIHHGTRYLGSRAAQVHTSTGPVHAGYVVNAAGLYADHIARDYGFGERYRILPFKGLYLYSDEPPGALRTHIYPVPDLRNPFLGVHFTLAVDGRIKIGPTALPALWREQYGGAENFRLGEFLEIVWRQMGLVVHSGFSFTRLAIEEMSKASRARMVARAAALADEVRLEHYRRWGRPGIRAQLADVEQRRLVMDFVCEGDDRSMHVLNAVSPGFTCSLPFARYVCDLIDANVSKNSRGVA